MKDYFIGYPTDKNNKGEILYFIFLDGNDCGHKESWCFYEYGSKWNFIYKIREYSRKLTEKFNIKINDCTINSI